MMTPAERQAAREQVAREIAGSHLDCEDSWYSCPLSENGCADDRQDKQECTCGRDARVDRIVALLAATEQAVLEEVYQQVKDYHFNMVTSKKGTEVVVWLEDWLRQQVAERKKELHE